MPHFFVLPVRFRNTADGIYWTVRISGLGDGMTAWFIHRSVERVTNGPGSACSHSAAVETGLVWTLGVSSQRK